MRQLRYIGQKRREKLRHHDRLKSRPPLQNPQHMQGECGSFPLLMFDVRSNDSLLLDFRTFRLLVFFCFLLLIRGIVEDRLLAKESSQDVGDFLVINLYIFQGLFDSFNGPFSLRLVLRIWQILLAMLDLFAGVFDLC